MSSVSINPPAPQEWRLCARTVIEALAQACPFAAGLATIYRYTHPSQMDLDIERWRADISGRVNDHSAAIATLASILTPKLRITEQAVALGVWIAQASPTGLGHPAIGIELLDSAFVDLQRDELLEAIVELEGLGMVDVLRAIGGIRQVRPQPLLFTTFDGPANGFDTVADAVHLAKLLLDNPTLARRVANLDAAAGLAATASEPGGGYAASDDGSRIGEQGNPGKLPNVRIRRGGDRAFSPAAIRSRIPDI